MAETNTSRIARLDEQNKTMSSDIREIKTDIKEIKIALESKFITKEEFTVYKALMDRELRDLRRTKNLQVVMSILVTAVITALVYNYFQRS